MALYFQETGSPTGDTIVFLHGGGAAGWMWQPQVAAMSDYHCLVPDLPEQGRSMDEKPFTIRGSAEKIAELIRTHAHGGKASIVGLSEGAQVGVALLALAPELIDHAVISSALLRPIPGTWMMTPGMIRLAFRCSVPPFKNNAWWIRLNMKYSAGIPDSFYPQFAQNFKEMSESGFVNLMVENQAFRLPHGLDKVTAPILIVVGRHEYAAMRDSARDLAAAIPGSQAYEVVHTIKRSLAQEHNWSMTTPELFTRTVRAWLTGQPLPEELIPLNS